MDIGKSIRGLVGHFVYIPVRESVWRSTRIVTDSHSLWETVYGSVLDPVYGLVRESVYNMVWLKK